MRGGSSSLRVVICSLAVMCEMLSQTRQPDGPRVRSLHYVINLIRPSARCAGRQTCIDRSDPGDGKLLRRQCSRCHGHCDASRQPGKESTDAAMSATERRDTGDVGRAMDSKTNTVKGNDARSEETSAKEDDRIQSAVPSSRPSSSSPSYSSTAKSMLRRQSQQLRRTLEDTAGRIGRRC